MYTIEGGVIYERIDNVYKQIARSEEYDFEYKRTIHLLDLANSAESLRAENAELKARVAELEAVVEPLVAAEIEWVNTHGGGWDMYINAANDTYKKSRIAIRDYVERHKPKPQCDINAADLRNDLDTIEQMIANVKAKLAEAK